MNHPAFSHPSSSQERTTGSSQDDSGVMPVYQPSGIDGVSQLRLSLTDEERERHIRSCGILMEAAMRSWSETGDFTYRGEADRWKLLMQEAIKGRSPAQVAKMERERGLA
jgi:hypothetical protein